ncbi:MAG: hypothetical protein AAGA12_08505 [Pseudomonadota bacterium]
MTSKTPKITLIVGTDQGYDTIQRTVGFLLKQTVLDQIELIVSCEQIKNLDPDYAELEQFGWYQVIESPGSLVSGQFIATAMNAANAPACMFLEEHNFPPPNTAEVAIKEIVENGRPALGFAMLPSNPGIVAWAHMYGQFGPAVAPLDSGPIHRFGGHHAAYSTEVMRSYGNKLADMMNNEAVLHEEMRKKGTPLYMTSDAVIPHAQISDFRTLVWQDYLAQRVYADARMKLLDWSLARRLLYVLGSPLIPFKRGAAAARHIYRTGRARRLMLPVVPVMFVAHCAGTWGEILGYMFGVGKDIKAERFEIELDRFSFVNESDKKEAQQGNFVRAED